MERLLERGGATRERKWAARGVVCREREMAKNNISVGFWVFIHARGRGFRIFVFGLLFSRRHFSSSFIKDFSCKCFFFLRLIY